MSTADKALRGVGGYLDDRLRGAKSLRTFFRKIFPDHWSFLLGEIALYSFIILLLTGTFLTLFFNPSMTDVVYHGTYTKLNGVRMSEAYASTLNISFDVRGGLLMRQIHHWAALLFLAAIMSHMLRIFFTGAFRKPREINWLIGVTLLTLGILEGFVGYSLPDDLLSGTGLRILEGVLLSIPIVGTYVTFFVLGGQFPGHLLIPRLYIVHVLLLPALILALVTAHLFIMFHQKHTQMPGKARTDHNVVGAPMYPYFMAKTGAFFFFIFAVLAGLSTVAQINPIWLFGPYNPAAISAGSQPDFYMGWLEGALRMMPAWQINLWGYALSLSVFIAALLIFGLLMTGLALYPFIEQWVTGDKREHHVLDRPRNAATRTAIGVAGVTFYGVLWLLGGNDLIAHYFDIQLYWTTWFGRIVIVVGPIVAYILTKRICLGLQRKDRELIEHGVESGIIRQLPSGEFIEVTRPPDEESRAAVMSRVLFHGLAADGEREDGLLPAETRAPGAEVAAPAAGTRAPAAFESRAPGAEVAVSEAESRVPPPEARHVMGRLRLRLNHVFREGISLQEGDGHGDGHGHGDGQGDGHRELPSADEESTPRRS